MLRLPKFIDELKQNKQWKFDWMKFIAIGLPSLCISLTHLQFYLPEGITAFTSQITLFSDSTIQLIAGIAFGYVLIDSLKK